MCDCFIQFAAEYPSSDPETTKLLEFCNYVRSSTPYEQLGAQMEAFVNEHVNVLKSGIVVGSDGDPSPGDIFEVPTAAIQLRGGVKDYSMNIGALYMAILSKTKFYKAGDKRKNPEVVCLYTMSVLNRCLKLAAFKAIDNRRLRESIDANSYKDNSFNSLRSPYSQMSLDKLRGIGARYVKKYKGAIEGVAGQGRAEQIAAVIQHADMSTLTGSDTIGALTSAINSENEDALEEVGKKLYANVVGSVHKATEVGDPGEQL